MQCAPSARTQSLRFVKSLLQMCRDARGAPALDTKGLGNQRTSRTGTSHCASTCAATEPITMRASAPWPWLPMRISS
jgi:hypothetical protein